MSASQHGALETKALANERAILSYMSTGPGASVPSQGAIAREPSATSPSVEPTTSFSSPSVMAKEDDSFREGMADLTYISPPQIQQTMSQGMVTPLTAAEDRAIETTVPTETSTPPPASPTTPSMDINRIAEEVYGIIERKLRSEKERRGYF